MRTPFRIAWWHIAIALVITVVLALLAVSLSLRASGRAHFLAQAEARRALGRPATIDDYLARAPQVDMVAHETWDAWSKSAAAAWTDPAYDRKAWDRWVTGLDQRPESIAATVAARRASYATPLSLLRRGDLVLSAYGWVVTDLPPGKRTLTHAAAVRLPNLLMVRDLAEWLRNDAALSVDPRLVLDDLDALRTALERQPGTIMDAMITVAVSAIRDRAYGDLALRGTLPPDRRERWLAEPSQALRCAADGFDGEAALFSGGLYAMVDQAGPFGSGFADHSVINALAAPWFWATAFNDAAVMLEVEGAIADRLRGTTSVAPPPWATIAPRLGMIGRIAVPNLLESCIFALEADAWHRCARLAVRLLDLGRGSGLPADHAAALATLGEPVGFAAAGDHLWLRYERLSDARFRLLIDPASPAPNFDDPKRMPSRGAKAGTPAASQPLVWERALIELPVPMAP